MFFFTLRGDIDLFSRRKKKKGKKSGGWGMTAAAPVLEDSPNHPIGYKKTRRMTMSRQFTGFGEPWVCLRATSLGASTATTHCK